MLSWVHIQVLSTSGILVTAIFQQKPEYRSGISQPTSCIHRTTISMTPQYIYYVSCNQLKLWLMTSLTTPRKRDLLVLFDWSALYSDSLLRLSPAPRLQLCFFAVKAKKHKKYIFQFSSTSERLQSQHQKQSCISLLMACSAEKRQQ